MMRRGGVLLATVTMVAGAAAAVPATAEPSRAEPVSTVFFGDSYAANFGIAPVHGTGDINDLLCFRAEENYPAVVARQSGERGLPLDVASDRSCGGALVEHFWHEQTLYPTDLTRQPQQEALGTETQLVVGTLGGNTVGFVRVLKQCSQKLREEGGLLPGTPIDDEQPADQCATYLKDGDGKDWLDDRVEVVGWELEELFDRISYFAPGSRAVLVGYPRVVPAAVAKCETPAPGQTVKPLADIPADALPVFDSLQRRLNDVMRAKATDAGATFVDLYAVTGDNTACDGANRGIGGLFEDSQVTLGDTALPWSVHPNTRGRDIQADNVTTAINTLFNA